MEVYRLSPKKYSSILSGKGAALKGARWNSPGTEIIYTSWNRSLAMAEVAVHLTLATLPSEFMLVTIYIPEDISIRILQVKELPENWNAFPYNSSTQFIGDMLIRDNQYCILKVPSVVTKGDFNLLINPYHKDFSRVKILLIEPFPFDMRIFK